MSSLPEDLLTKLVELPGLRRLRFAPSPTGELHIGNVRTALLSYCLAGEDGRFLVRIEDTDRERYQPESVPGYLETLAWLGMHWDEGPDIGGPCEPYVESERLPYFQEAAGRLVAEGAAYRCFCTKQRLDELRAAQRAAGLPTRYDGRCRNLSAEEVAARLERGEPSVVRLRVPPGETRWDDLVLGPQLFENDSVDDQVLLKSDGFPTYHLAQVVDDHLMGITQVVRAVEWLPSTPKHLITYAALGWDPPQFAHVALVLGPDHSKLSKRHGAQTVAEFRAMGYLAEALVNFLAFLGWSPGTEEEIFTLARAALADQLRPPPGQPRDPGSATAGLPQRGLDPKADGGRSWRSESNPFCPRPTQTSWSLSPPWCTSASAGWTRFPDWWGSPSRSLIRTLTFCAGSWAPTRHVPSWRASQSALRASPPK